MRTIAIAAVVTSILAVMTLADRAHGDAPRPESASSGFKQRVDAFFKAEAGKPLVRAAKKPPLGAGRGNYTRAYSYSIVEFAARCLYLGEMLDEANAALVENAQHYIDNPKDIVDRDSFHWHADIVMRLIDMYGSNGTSHAGRLTPETEAMCLRPIWTYVKTSAKHNVPDHAETKTWHFLSTENHHAMDFTVQWHFAKLAKDRPEYRDERFDDGSTLADRYQAWNDYIVVYCQERAKKGTNIEIMCPGYNSVWLKGFYNFRDFGEPRVRRAAGMLMDLYWTYWTQEQLNGVSGGGATRIRGGNGFSSSKHGIPALGWMYFGTGQRPTVINGETSALLSDYEPPALVCDIARTARDKGPYEIRQRAQGLGETGVDSAIRTNDCKPNRFRTDGGGIVRYTYCDPAFTIGTLMHEPRPNKDWVAISSQSRWQGVVFRDAPGARIVPVVRPAGKHRDVLNGHWSVQSKGSLITQKLKDNKGGGPMIVWLSREGLGEPVREGDVVFVQTQSAFAAIRVVGTDFKLVDEQLSTPTLAGPARVSPPGWYIQPNDDFAPVIIEVMTKQRIATFDEFKRRVKTRDLKMKGSVVRYETVYDDTLTLDTSYRATPTINGTPVDYAPRNVQYSPFINSVYDSGVVTISNGEHTMVLDFNTLNDSGTEEGSVTPSTDNGKDREAFEQADELQWHPAFADDCTGDWTGGWFLDGEVGTVRTGPDGMTLTAGSEFKNDSHHMVLWTKRSFTGDVKVEYDYTRRDDENRCVTIMYIQATGSGAEGFDTDITRWNDRRRVPAMRLYYDHMHTYHLSYAAFGNDGATTRSYIRGRRYMPTGGGLRGTEMKPEYWSDTLFAKDVKHHLMIIKKDRDLLLRIENPREVFYGKLVNTSLPAITEGRIGLRHMFTRSATYRNFRISTLAKPSE